MFDARQPPSPELLELMDQEAQRRYPDFQMLWQTRQGRYGWEYSLHFRPRNSKAQLPATPLMRQQPEWLPIEMFWREHGGTELDYLFSMFPEQIDFGLHSANKALPGSLWQDLQSPLTFIMAAGASGTMAFSLSFNFFTFANHWPVSIPLCGSINLLVSLWCKTLPDGFRRMWIAYWMGVSLATLIFCACVLYYPAWMLSVVASLFVFGFLVVVTGVAEVIWRLLLVIRQLPKFNRKSAEADTFPQQSSKI